MFRGPCFGRICQRWPAPVRGGFNSFTHYTPGAYGAHLFRLSADHWGEVKNTVGKPLENSLGSTQKPIGGCRAHEEESAVCGPLDNCRSTRRRSSPFRSSSTVWHGLTGRPTKRSRVFRLTFYCHLPRCCLDSIASFVPAHGRSIFEHERPSRVGSFPSPFVSSFIFTCPCSSSPLLNSGPTGARRRIR